MKQRVIDALKGAWAKRESVLKRDGQRKNEGACDFMAGAVAAVNAIDPSAAPFGLSFKVSAYGAGALEKREAEKVAS